MLPVVCSAALQLFFQCLGEARAAPIDLPTHPSPSHPARPAPPAVTRSAGFLGVQQDEPYGDIMLSRGLHL